jgi:protein-S-isoprenylcysteine O-methyltransferase Ste14
MCGKRILPPLYLLAALVVMAALHVVLPVKQFLFFPSSLVGVLPIAGGVLINVWSEALFHRRGTTVLPFEKTSRLVTTGPYRFTRNPMYLGMVAILAGVALLLGSVAPALVVPAFAWSMQKRFIEPEERQLEEAFGEEYRTYRRRVRRWL